MNKGKEPFPPRRVIERHFSCLKAVKDVLGNSVSVFVSIGLYWAFRENGVSSRGSLVLQEMGVIAKYKDRKGYRWKGGKPSMEMAQLLAVNILKKDRDSLNRKIKDIEKYLV